MFARAGISSRAFRGEHKGGFFGRPKKKKKEKRKFRCYLPFMWSTCVAICGGLGVLCGGTAMCVTGYYAKNFTSIEVSNGTDTWYEVDPIPFAIMWNMTYVGPILMGCGCFAIVIACVVVCETRDKMLRIIENDEKQGKKTTTKPDFYDLVIKKFKRDPEMRMAEAKQVEAKQTEATGVDFIPAPRRKSIFNMMVRRSSVKSIKSTKSEFTHIGGALRQIPMHIFAIDLEQKKNTSLLPVSLTLCVDIGGMKLPGPNQSLDSDLYLAPKYPSASCIVDLLKLNDEKLTALFPDMNSWLAEVQPLSRKWRRMTRHSLVPFSPKETYSESRDADDSDSDSLCSVTVHVQPAKEKTPSNLLSVSAGTDNSNFFQFPPNTADVKPVTSTGAPSGLLIPNSDRSPTDVLRRGSSCDIERSRRNSPIDSLVMRPVRRRSLLRQKPVTEECFTPQSQPNNQTNLVEPSTGEQEVQVKDSPNLVCDTSDQDSISTYNEFTGTHIASKGGHVNNSDTPSRNPDISRPVVPRLTPIVCDNPMESGRHDKTQHLNRDLMKTFDIPKTNSRTLLCSNDSDEISESGGETNSLLRDSDDTANRHSLPRPATTSGNTRRQEAAQTPPDGMTSIFIPYTPKESNARSNSNMQKSKPLARSLTNLMDKTLFANLRSSHPAEMTSFVRHPLTSRIHTENERMPVARQMRRSRTIHGVTEKAS